MSELTITIAPDVAEASNFAARAIARSLASAIKRNGRATVAFSRIEPELLDRLRTAKLDWASVRVFQVDERSAIDGSDDRNATALDALANLGARVHRMPVGDHDLTAAARAYEAELARLTDGALDVVHLGLGADGHTASLFPADVSSMTAASDRRVVPGGTHDGFRRLTLSLHELNSARRVVWLVTGEDKAVALRNLVAADPSTPAGRVLQDRAEVVADEAAAALILTGG